MTANAFNTSTISLLTVRFIRFLPIKQNELTKIAIFSLETKASKYIFYE